MVMQITDPSITVGFLFVHIEVSHFSLLIQELALNSISNSLRALSFSSQNSSAKLGGFLREDICIRFCDDPKQWSQTSPLANGPLLHQWIPDPNKFLNEICRVQSKNMQKHHMWKLVNKCVLNNSTTRIEFLLNFWM